MNYRPLLHCFLNPLLQSLGSEGRIYSFKTGFIAPDSGHVDSAWGGFSPIVSLLCIGTIN